MKLDLKAITAAKNSLGEVKAMKAIGWSWEKPSVPSGAAFVATGPGEAVGAGAMTVLPLEGVIAGDLLVLAIACRGDEAAPAIAGYSLIGFAPSVGNSATSKTHVYQRIAQAAGNAASFLVVSAAAAQIYAFRGAASAVLVAITAPGASTS